MKKNLKLMAAAALCMAALTACGGGKSASADPTTEAPVTTEAPTTEAETTAETTEAVVETEAEYYSQDVYITNSTGVTIMELYISSADSNDWGEDLLGGEVFAADETVLFTPDVVGTADAAWDIMIIDEDEDEVTFEDINLSSATALELHWGADGQTPTVTITGSEEEEYFSQDLDITNSTGVAILEFYISPSEEDNWGEDMLGGTVFAADETMQFTTELVGTADAAWDIMIVDEDGDQVVFEAINFSSAESLVLHWGADGQSPTVDIN